MMDTRTKETIRYLGYRNRTVDDRTFSLIKKSLDDLDREADTRIIYRIFNISFLEDEIMIGNMHIRSKNLKKNLMNCKQVILLAATLGVKVDYMLRKESIKDMSGAVVVQAAAAATLEEFLDLWQNKQREEFEKQGRYLRPRFSPGYGDFDIRHQMEIVSMLDAGKKIGLSVTESCMLTPTKSVTALIGVGEEVVECDTHGCESCGKIDCGYRRV